MVFPTKNAFEHHLKYILTPVWHSIIDYRKPHAWNVLTFQWGIRDPSISYLSICCGSVGNVSIRSLAILSQASHKLGGIGVKVMRDVREWDLTTIKILECGIYCLHGRLKDVSTLFTSCSRPIEIQDQSLWYCYHQITSTIGLVSSRTFHHCYFCQSANCWLCNHVEIWWKLLSILPSSELEMVSESFLLQKNKSTSTDMFCLGVCSHSSLCLQPIQKQNKAHNP